MAKRVGSQCRRWHPVAQRSGGNTGLCAHLQVRWRPWIARPAVVAPAAAAEPIGVVIAAVEHDAGDGSGHHSSRDGYVRHSESEREQ